MKTKKRKSLEEGGHIDAVSIPKKSRVEPDKADQAGAEKPSMTRPIAAHKSRKRKR